jgi:serine/threonine protein kinase
MAAGKGSSPADTGGRPGKKNNMAGTLEGQTLGKYRVLEPLGRGGMARVYRGYHPELDRYVAIKVLRPDLVEEEEFLGRFKREARSVAALRHPNIVQVYDFDVQGDATYMVMELLEGATLKSPLNRARSAGKPMDLGQAARIMLDVLEGLSYAHGEKMIHRDLKPANILLTSSGQAVIADFGIAHIIGGTRQTISGALMGTLNYMAPEQGLEGVCDERSDIYSLGVILYEMLTQRIPFDADTPLAILMKHVNDPLPLPRQIDPSIPEPFERVVLKALAKKPEDRYQTAAEMAEAVREAAEESGIELPPQISVPASPAHAPAPSVSAAVLSGQERDDLSNASFAAQDTDTSIERQRRGEQVRGRLSAPPRRSNAGLAVAGAILLPVLGNLCLLTAAATTGSWTLYTSGWPIQVFLAGWVLSLIMYLSSSIWMLIPAGPTVVTAVILTYCQLTGNWNQWSFLWLFEAWGVVVSVGLPIFVGRHKSPSRAAGRLIALLLSLVCIGGIIFVGLSSGLETLLPELSTIIQP